MCLRPRAEAANRDETCSAVLPAARTLCTSGERLEQAVLARGTRRTRPGGEPVKAEGSPAAGREGSGGVLRAADHAHDRGTERCPRKLLMEEGEPPAPRSRAGRREVTAGN